MKKQLNETGIVNELTGGNSAFFRDSAPQHSNLSDDTKTVRSNARTVERSDDRTDEVEKTPEVGKRETKRHSFEIYQDQLGRLQQIKAKAMIEGRNVSMSDIVREALDNYMREHE